MVVTGFTFQNTMELLPKFEPFSQFPSVVTEESYCKKSSCVSCAIILQNSDKHLNTDEKCCVCKIYVLFL